MPWDKRLISYRLHWLLPDWEWQAGMRESAFEIRLKSPYGWVTLIIYNGIRIPNTEYRISLFRAGEPVYSSGAGEPESQPETTTRGWVSPTYGIKVPALSLAFETKSAIDVQFMSEFNFPL
jgi:hypothetical protein